MPIAPNELRRLYRRLRRKLKHPTSRRLLEKMQRLQSRERRNNTGDASPLNPPVVFNTVMPTGILHAAAPTSPSEIIQHAIIKSRSLRGLAAQLEALPVLGGRNCLATIRLNPQPRRPFNFDARRVRLMADELSRLTNYEFQYRQFTLGRRYTAITFAVKLRPNQSIK